MHEDYFNLEIAVAVVVFCAQSLGSKRQQPRRADLGDLGPRSLHCNVNSCLFFLDVSENPFFRVLFELSAHPTESHSAELNPILKLTVKGISLEI